MKPTSDHLHLGCGTTTPAGWLNVDGSWKILLARHPVLKHLLVWLRLLSKEQAETPWSPTVVRLDLTRPLPFPDESFQVIYCSHTLEHLYYNHALNLLKECHRVLKQGGICRFVVPDLENIVRYYVSTKQQGESGAGKYLMEILQVHDKQPRQGLLGWFQRLLAYQQHKWMYDSESLTDLFREAGFANAEPSGYLQSRIERIAEVEKPSRVIQGAGAVVESSKE